MKMKLLMESFRRSLKENFSDNATVVNTKEYTEDGVEVIEQEYSDGSILLYTVEPQTGEMEFSNAYKSKAHLDSRKVTKKLIPLLNREVEDINHVASLVDGLSDSGDEVMQFAVEGIRQIAQEKIDSLEQEKRTIEDQIEQYRGTENYAYGHGEEDEQAKSFYATSAKTSKELESIKRKIDALRKI